VLAGYSLTGVTIGSHERLLTVAGVAHARVVAVDASTSTSRELGDVRCMGDGHREVVGVGYTVDVLDRVDDGDSYDG